MTRARLVHGPIDVAAVLSAVGSDGHGATSLFVGTVRDHADGRAVTGIDYSAYEGMALRELSDIAAEAGERFGVAVAIEHRRGTLAGGEASVAVATAHARRAPALESAAWIVEELKRRVPIWKREHYADGSRGWVAASDSTAAAPAHGVAPGGAAP